jgi:DUF1680 family protein
MCKYADYIDQVFGVEPCKLRGYDGHPEIELALVKLYRVTKNSRYLKLALFFIDERGQLPHFYDQEAERRGIEVAERYEGEWAVGRYAYCQAHKPVREQDTAEGHVVRALYLYCGMVDVAAETGDETLLKACYKLWDNVVNKRMYVTGGLGSKREGERFTFDYDLPNESAYAETCASIALVLWAHRMLHIDIDRRFSDVLERALYNGVLSGISLSGDHYFYANPLQVYPDAYKHASISVHQNVSPIRRAWYSCSCCPTNLARTLTSIGQYVYSSNGTGIWIHLYAQSHATLDMDNSEVHICMLTNYPWEGNIEIQLELPEARHFQVALRIPGWCLSYVIHINGEELKDVPITTKKGYVFIDKRWQSGDKIEIAFDMPVKLIESHPAVRMNTGKIALQRGPIVYCLEEMDNGNDLGDISVKLEQPWEAVYEPEMLGGVTVLKGWGTRRKNAQWQGHLYLSALTERQSVQLTAVPYYAWCNRTPGEMIVWLNTIED